MVIHKLLIEINTMATYQIHKDNKGEYYWTLRSDKNYKTITNIK